MTFPSKQMMNVSHRGRWILFSAAVVLYVVLGPLADKGALAFQFEEVTAQHGMVVAAESLAALAGVKILQQGGNAVDAAVAVGFALAVTYPEAGNIGGGGFMVIRLADGRTSMVDFREKAPAQATRTMYLDSLGNVIPNKSVHGPLAAGVPGSVAGLLLALEKYGTMSRASVLSRAIRLAEGGFHLPGWLAKDFNDHTKDFHSFLSTKKIFAKKTGRFAAGELFRQPDLARTLDLIREKGRDGFYRGDVAEKIVAEMRRSGGIITLADLENYQAVEREPLRGSYRGYEIITASPPSAGGVLLLQLLNMLEQYDLKALGHNSAQTIHLFASAAQRAFADRAEFLGDPDVVQMPIQELISKEYARHRSRDIAMSKAVASKHIRAGMPNEHHHHETTHYCVVDRYGNAVSVTTTLNGLYGCKTVVDGAGFFLNNEMDDFSIKPGLPNMYGLTGGDANAIAPNKRMLSSMAPTIVVKEGKPFVLVGARGGSRIPTAVANIIINVIDFGMGIKQAVEASRVHHQWLPDEILIESRGLPHETVEALRKMGWTVKDANGSNARAQALMFDPNRSVFIGGPDSREHGVAIGY